jgi:hypothetical protein
MPRITLSYQRKCGLWLATWRSREAIFAWRKWTQHFAGSITWAGDRVPPRLTRGAHWAKTAKLSRLPEKLEDHACDKTICFLSTSVPVRWQLQVFPLERIRAVDIRHK